MIEDTMKEQRAVASGKRPRQLLTERITSLDGYYTLEELAWFRNQSYFQTRRWLIAKGVQCFKIGGVILVPAAAAMANVPSSDEAREGQADNE